MLKNFSRAHIKYLFSVLIGTYYMPVFSQKDSTSSIRIGCNFILAPIAHLMDDQKNEHNFGPGILLFANFDNVVEISTGGLFHAKKYIVVDDKVYKPATTTEFHIIDVPVKLNISLIRTKTQCSYLSGGITFGLPIYKEGGLEWQSVDFMDSQNFSYQFGMGYRTSINRNRNVFFQIEPNLSFFTSQIVYGDYYEISSGSPYPPYAGTLIGNHSRVSLRMFFSIKYEFIKIKSKQ